ncbi:MAG: ABC transporter ATP-binding protein [Ruegeria sp.]
MSIAHLLEDFTAGSEGGIHLLDEDALEEQRLASFERGYGAGWEDAIAAQQTEQDRVSADFSATLSDLSFTYHEALARMSLSLEPMFDSLCRIVLPEMLDKGFPARLTEQLNQMAQDQIARPMQVIVPVGLAERVKAILPEALSPPVQVIEDPALQPGQARVQVGTARRQVDCSALLASVSGAFDAYVFEAKEALSNE